MADNYVENLLGEKERVLFTTHQHVFILLSTMTWEILFTVVTLIVVSLLWAFQVTPLAPVGYALLIIPLVGMVADFMEWNNRKFIITNRRVIQVAGVFNKNVTDSSLEKVNDVKLEQSFLGRTFNYGDVEILTASELGMNQFLKISDPIKFKTAMLNAKEEMGSDEDNVRYVSSAQPRAAEPNEIPDLIARLDALRRQGAISEAEFQNKKAELLRRIN